MNCPSCGETAPTRCGHCGAVLDLGAVENRTGRFLDIFAAISRERTGIAAALAVLLVTLLVSHLTWTYLAQPAVNLGKLFPAPGTCDQLNTGIGSQAMYVCSAKVALTRVAPALLLMVLLFPLRGLFTGGSQALARSFPEGIRFFVTPAMVAALFTLMWAGIHPNTRDAVGIVTQAKFPAVIATLAFLMVRWNGAIQRELRPFFELRRRVPTVINVTIALLIPMAAALMLTNQSGGVTNAIEKEQFVVMLALVLGYFALTGSTRVVRKAIVVKVEAGTAPTAVAANVNDPS